MSFGKRATQPPMPEPLSEPASLSAPPPPASVESDGLMRLWQIAIVVLVAELLLQLFPLTGVVLMMLLAPFWSVVLVNAILLLMAADALLVRRRRWLLIVPIAAYGANLCAWGAGELAYQRLQAQTLRANAAQRIAFDPARMALVDMHGGTVEALVGGYVLDAAYERNANSPPYLHLAYRLLPKPTCDAIQQDTHAQVMKMGAHVGSGLRQESIRNACLLRMPDDPSLPPLVISADERSEHEKGLLDIQRTKISLAAPDGRTATLVSGSVGAPRPIPMPAIGCALNDGAASWDCFAEFMRAPRPLGASGGRAYADPVRIVATALGLKPRTVTARQDRFLDHTVTIAESEMVSAVRAGAPAIARATALADQEVVNDLATLDQLVKDPTLPMPSGIQWTLTKHADRVAADPERLARGLRAAFAAPPYKAAEAKRLFETVAAALPAEAFARIGTELVGFAAAGGPDVEPTLLTRLGDAGAPAVGFLLGRAQLRPDSDRGIAAVLGLCRAGASAAGWTAEALAQMPHARSNGDDGDLDLEEAVYVALKRLGRPDLAAPVRGMPRPPLLVRISKMDGVTPASPAAECATNEERRPLARVPWLPGPSWDEPGVRSTAVIPRP